MRKTLSKHGEIILNTMSQKIEKWDSLVLGRGDFWIIWRCHGIPCFHFIFCLETTVKENNWMGTTSVAVVVTFLRSCHSESTWSQPCSKFFLNNYEAPWQRHLKDTLQLKILRTWIYALRFFRNNKSNFDEVQCYFSWRSTAAKCYCVFILHETLASINGKN